MESIHVKIDDDIHHWVKQLLPFHGGTTHAVRIALRRLKSDIEAGNVNLKDLAPITEAKDDGKDSPPDRS